MFQKLLLSLIMAVPVIALADNFQNIIDNRAMIYNTPEDKFHNTISSIYKFQEETGSTVSTRSFLKVKDIRLTSDRKATIWLTSISRINDPKENLKKGDITKDFIEFDCDEYAVAYLSRTRLRDNKVVLTINSKNKEYFPIIPDSGGATIASKVCIVQSVLERKKVLGM